MQHCRNMLLNLCLDLSDRVVHAVELVIGAVLRLGDALARSRLGPSHLVFKLGNDVTCVWV